MTEYLEDFTDKLILDGTKIGWYPERIAAWERGEKIAPVTIDAALTRQCNYACHFCYAMMQENERKEITKDIAFAFLDDCAEIGVKGISWISDGESTVHPDYVEIVKHGARRGIAMGAGSNGLLLDREALEQVLPALTYLRFNFSGGERGRYAEIMGVKEGWFDKVCQNVRDAMAIKRRDNLPVTINMQMVCMPQDADQIVPLARLARELRPDYLIIKHCADDVRGQLGVDYSQYEGIYDKLREAEAMSEPGFRVQVKWSRIESKGERTYSRCYGPPFIMQVSGSGLVAPCGFLFNERYKAFHIGNICDQRFRDIWASDRYWEVMRYLGSDEFNPQKRCGPNCLQHNTNTFLFDHKHRSVALPTSPMPAHAEFL
jgi:MoaA/NifB/PqqE/SkfB family radical SAM enzyme